MTGTPLRVLLGPQNPVRNIHGGLNETGLPDGQIAVISAGWQEAENDIDDIREIAGRTLVDLELYRRAEDVFDADASLQASYRDRQERLKEQQRLYRIRLQPLALAARRMLRYKGNTEVATAERRHAIAQLRALDRHHLNRSEAINLAFHAEFDAHTHDSLTGHVREIRDIVDGCSGVLITGGNVAILINRLRLFGLGELLASKPVVAWSAGAMALAERIVLFHDHMPHGRRDPEVFGAGLGLVPGYIVMPDASNRLRFENRSRIRLTAQRFAPDVCITFDNASLLALSGEGREIIDGVRRLDRKGRHRQLKAA